MLQKIGLTQGESKVYIAMLGLGQTTTGPIVRKAGVTTSKSYKILARLEEKGLASHVYKNKVKYFKSAPPEKIIDIIIKKEAELQESKKETKKIISELNNYQKKSGEMQEADVFYGIAGLDTVFGEQLRVLNKGEYSFVIGIASEREYSESVSIFFEKLQHLRDKKGIMTNLLYGEDARKTIEYQEKSKFCHIKYLPYSSLVSINIYKDVILICVFSGEPITFKIKSKKVADSFMEYFNLLWKSAKN